MCQFVDRDDELRTIRDHLHRAFDERPSYRLRLLILQGAACVGKSRILEHLQDYIPQNLSACSYRITQILDVAQLVEDGVALHEAFNRCAGSTLAHSGSLADHAQALQDALVREGKPLLVRLDNIEALALNGPHVREVRNLLLLKLLRNPGPTLPVVFVCAARHLPSHKIPYLTHVAFQGAAAVIAIQPFGSPDMLQSWLGLSTDDARQVWDLSAGNPGVAKFLANNVQQLKQPGERPHVLRAAIDALMGRKLLPPNHLEALHRVVRETQNRFLPERLERLSELMKSSFVDYDERGRFYFVCPPLGSLLQEVDHV